MTDGKCYINYENPGKQLIVMVELPDGRAFSIDLRQEIWKDPTNPNYDVNHIKMASIIRIGPDGSCLDETLD